MIYIPVFIADVLLAIWDKVALAICFLLGHEKKYTKGFCWRCLKRY